MLVGGRLIATDRVEQCLELNSAKHSSMCLYWSENCPTELEWGTQMCPFPNDFQERGLWYALLPAQQNLENKIFWHCDGFNVKNWDFGSCSFSTVPLCGFNFQAV